MMTLWFLENHLFNKTSKHSYRIHFDDYIIHWENEDFLSMKIYRYPFKLRLAKENIFGVEQQIMQRGQKNMKMFR